MIIQGMKRRKHIMNIGNTFTQLLAMLLAGITILLLGNGLVKTQAESKIIIWTAKTCLHIRQALIPSSDTRKSINNCL